MKIALLCTLFCFMNNSFAGLKVGSTLTELVLKGDNGTLKGESWSSKQFSAPINVFFYIDPDEKDANNKMSDLLKEKKYPKDKVHYFAAINYAATSTPNFILSSILKKKQRKYPSTLYLRDYDKTGVKVWKLQDDANTMTIIDSKSKVLFSKFGKLSDQEIQKAIAIIEKRIGL